MTKFSIMRRRVLLILCCLVVSSFSLHVLARESRNRSGQGEGRRHAVVDRALLKAKHRILIRLQDGVQIGSVQPKLPKGMTISQSQGTLVIIQSQNQVSPEDLQGLLKIPGIAHAQIDSVVITQEDRENCQPSMLSQLIQKLGLPASLTGCTTSTVCPNSSKSKLWAQERVDVDLMDEELKRMGIRSADVNVAVIDSGFDLQANQKLMASSSLKVKKGHDQAGDPTADEDGHGTMVAGLIGAKSGIGIAPEANLTVYRVSEPESEGATSHASLQLSIERACSEGNDIINVSWGENG